MLSVLAILIDASVCNSVGSIKRAQAFAVSACAAIGDSAVTEASLEKSIEVVCA